ncbi:MAG: 6-phosphofructokinase [Clostridia bacterium]|nr:6-phosphofructokinase [Clostridia bacterium]
MSCQKLVGAAVVGQSGGPTAVINATLAGVIRAALSDEAKGTITELYGMRNGIEGFIDGRFVSLSSIFTTPNGTTDEEKLALLTQTPASALGSCRKKLPDPEKDPEFFERLISRFKENNIRYFFYIGGNDSMDTVAKLSRFVTDHEYDMRVIGLPKTIDNDLPGTDHAPGYGSAAKLIAAEVQEIVRDCAVYTVPAVTIVEIMGRDAGWLTAASALPRILGGYAPDLVYLPECDFSMDAFFGDLRSILKMKPNIVVAVSEGVRFADGTYVGESTQSGVKDAFGHKYLAGTAKMLTEAVKAEFGCKVRSIELNLPQRCGAHFASQTDLTEAADAGSAGVKAAVSGETGSMIAILRDETAADYAVIYKPANVQNIANGEQKVPDKFITEEKNNVTDECLRYIAPLIKGEPKLIMNGGIPVHFVFD